ncbi:MAG: 50S ribosomal protein L23 [Firmicutes bacterium]|uniref:Large ribosomal subunit protein uL23 n=1 Tax=Candidatus Gallilactobacillus intestinavium TaxID=2840838 RepID=A0A9D9E9V5_9LACO|nr:50S ribosomal protein L23 [Candidatus Gallilactobacillus intestinavium]
MDAQDIILRPVVTEASMADVDEKRYTFDVALNATKPEIRKAIEKIFDVQVAKVNVMNVKGKPKRRGRYNGYTSRRRKAIITLTEDSKKIKLFDEE